MSESPEFEPSQIQDDEATENDVVELRPEDIPDDEPLAEVGP